MSPHQAMDALNARGETVEPSDIPGLYIVAGRGELTGNQLIDLLRLKLTPLAVSESKARADIEAAVEMLNHAIARAADAGLAVEVVITPFQRIGWPDATYMVGAQITRLR